MPAHPDGNHQRLRVGWREWVYLPELSPWPLKAKIDTGARTSALHAYGLTVTMEDDIAWARFQMHPIQRSSEGASVARCRVIGFRRVRSSTGHSQTRPVIRTPLRIGQHELPIEVTLTPRDQMGFRLLLGRSAIRRRFVVDPGRSFLHALPQS